ncbi:MAG: capsule biosynthesis protein CapA [Paracoccus sp. (in: a-proteobacteria)]|uniref:capsule biosynthesis protein n=1 Tax=Paracoccus sp. TaxID=267 RepID=UPI0026E069D2|nr:capsule biosynthesis protein CapA [Paracoccus sp. (in: a-proteobacteria)]MDO5621369.1 capsule biosynthesis protein CapA [Paracoccus sp. (in: a-proteobacteria)]
MPQRSDTDLPHLLPQERVFLLLQGPHGPFFDRLGRMLRMAGAQVWRAGFNAGDRFFWSDPAHFIAHLDPVADWPAHLDRIIADKGVTDIVLYGDARPVHLAAREAAQRLGLTLHVFEEGYLRPFWISYERGGSNGWSELMNISIDRMRHDLRDARAEISRPPSHWGDMRQHKFYGALYHFLLLTANRGFPAYKSHRKISVMQEFRLHLRRVILSPFLAMQRRLETARIRRGGWPYVLVLMQLDHDASLRTHSDYSSQEAFIREVATAFAENAPRHHHLVFKAHPLEDGRARDRATIRQLAQGLGISDRVHYVLGGKLAGLMALARSAVTVNSTAAQQALWRGLPVLATGRGVFVKPGLVADQSLAGFMADPQRPDAAAYRIYRDYLLETSQIPGGFYAARSRAHALRLVVDLMLAEDNPYDSLSRGRAAHRQQIVARDT